MTKERKHILLFMFKYIKSIKLIFFSLILQPKYIKPPTID